MKERTVEIRQPEAKGLEVIDMVEMPISDLQSHTGPAVQDEKTGKWDCPNAIRVKGIDGAFVAQFVALIEKGLYMKYYYVPPVIDEDCNIIAGETRYVAHSDAKEKTMWVAICRFVECDGKSGLYWRKMYQSNENAGLQREIEGNTRTETDLIHFTKGLCEDPELKEVTFDEEGGYQSIRKALKDQGYTDPDKITDLVSAICILGGHTAKAVRGYTKLRVSDEIARAGMDQPDLVRLMENHTGRDPDYDHRIFKETEVIMSTAFENGGYHNVEILLYWKGQTPRQLDQAHVGKQNLFHDQYIISKKLVDLYESGNLEKYVNVRFKGQTIGEEVYSNFVPVMNYKQDYETK